MTSDHGALKTHFNSIPEREIGRANNISDRIGSARELGGEERITTSSTF